jgi:hypothetical protein
MHARRRAVFVAIAALACLVVLGAGSARAGDGVVFTFTSGTGDAPGRITVTNASSGSTTSVGLLPKMSAASCASLLSDLAPKVGFKTEVGGASVTILGHGVVVKIEGPTFTKSDK